MHFFPIDASWERAKCAKCAKRAQRAKRAGAVQETPWKPISSCSYNRGEVLLNESYQDTPLDSCSAVLTSPKREIKSERAAKLRAVGALSP